MTNSGRSTGGSECSTSSKTSKSEAAAKERQHQLVSSESNAGSRPRKLTVRMALGAAVVAERETWCSRSTSRRSASESTSVSLRRITKLAAHQIARCELMNGGGRKLKLLSLPTSTMQQYSREHCPSPTCSTKQAARPDGELGLSGLHFRTKLTCSLRARGSDRADQPAPPEHA